MRIRGSLSVLAATFGLLAVLGIGRADGLAQAGASSANSIETPPPPRQLVLTSAQFHNGGQVERAQLNQRCGGRDVSPALKWHDAPLGTKSYVLLMHDPDAPKVGGFWHWVVYDIPASVTSLPADAGDPHKHLLPTGAVQARSDFGTRGYGGPCPPPGRAHRYVIRLYAMPNTKLNVPHGAKASIIAAYADAMALGRAQIMARYGR